MDRPGSYSLDRLLALMVLAGMPQGHDQPLLWSPAHECKMLVLGCAQESRRGALASGDYILELGGVGEAASDRGDRLASRRCSSDQKDGELPCFVRIGCPHGDTLCLCQASRNAGCPHGDTLCLYQASDNADDGAAY